MMTCPVSSHCVGADANRGVCTANEISIHSCERIHVHSSFERNDFLQSNAIMHDGAVGTTVN